ncbi:hypothetical protein HPP92_011458 [Vanilla planifolia]|uniref:Uncharacterized protein n=1 Tax=Vanilla planifolia TaxID=51239 RepID=A0A835R2W5_VANPL|nr:hypothetical protein HPP92_011458 [Vanilla planifolia]
MASFRSKAISLLAMTGVSVASLVGYASAAEAPAPAPASSASYLSAAVGQVLIACSVALLIGALRA